MTTTREIRSRVWAIAEGHNIESSVPIVVQHTRLGSRQAANAQLSTIAYAAS